MSQHEGPTFYDFHTTGDSFTSVVYDLKILHVYLVVNVYGDFDCTQHRLTERDCDYRDPIFVRTPGRQTNLASGAEFCLVTHPFVSCASIYFARIRRYTDNYTNAIGIKLCFQFQRVPVGRNVKEATRTLQRSN